MSYRNVNEKTKANNLGFEEYEFVHKNNSEHIPHGLRTEIRKIMQTAYFVIPDEAELISGFERVKEIKALLDEGNYIINADYIEAKSLATVAYLILKEATDSIKTGGQNENS